MVHFGKGNIRRRNFNSRKETNLLSLMHLDASRWNFHPFLMNFSSIIMLPGSTDLIYYVAGYTEEKISNLNQEYFFRSLQEREEINRVVRLPEMKALSLNVGYTIHSVFKMSASRAK